MKLCFATNNNNKLNEVRALLSNSFDLVGLKDIGFEQELAEDHSTIEENSEQKAEFIYNNFRINCFADDTGLEVFALNLDPGVRSAMYAGPQRSDIDNISLLLKNLEGKQERSAQFKTVITLLLQGQLHRFTGIVKGSIAHERRGAHGFGYDPIFIPEGYNVTFAEMALQEKNQISHRARAINQLTEFLKHC